MLTVTTIQYILCDELGTIGDGKSYVFLRTREHSTRLMETNELRYTLWVQPIR